jgi:hypothetical protein
VPNEYHYVLVFRKLSEGGITVDNKQVYKNKCGSRGNFKIRFMVSDLRMWILDSLNQLSKC